MITDTACRHDYRAVCANCSDLVPWWRAARGGGVRSMIDEVGASSCYDRDDNLVDHAYSSRVFNLSYTCPCGQ